MNSNLYWVLLVVLMLGLPCHSRRSSEGDNGNDALMKCVQDDLCKCKKTEDYADCWDELLEETQRFGIDSINEICEVTVGYDESYSEMIEKLCTLEDDKMSACYNTMSDEMNKYLVEHDGSSEPESKKISEAAANARTCLMPPISRCNQPKFDDEC